MSLPPDSWTELILENQTPQEIDLVEWENPEISTPKAFMATLRRVLLAPKKFFECLPLSGGLGEPLGFALLVGTIGVLSSLLWQLLLEGDFSASMPAVAFSKQVGNLINDPRVIIGIFLLTPFLVALGQFFLSMCLVWAVRLTGQGKNSFESVFRVVAYSQAPAVFCLIPLAGALVAAVWHLIILILGISKKFDASYIKAIFILFLATVFQGILFFGFFLLIVFLGILNLLFP
jgi:hypothetical protein